MKISLGLLVLMDISRIQIDRFLEVSGLNDSMKLGNMFPLTFATRWGGAIFNDFSGIFDIK